MTEKTDPKTEKFFRGSLDHFIETIVEPKYPQQDWFRRAVEESRKPDPRRETM